MNRGPSIADRLQGGKEAAENVCIIACFVQPVCALSRILEFDTSLGSTTHIHRTTRALYL
jgi:hypothetical protein